MSLAKSILAVLVLSVGLSARAQYAAKVTLNTGHSFVVKQLNIQGDRLYPESDQASTSVASIRDVEFRFAGINLKLCETMFSSGDRKSLESLLAQYVGPVVQYSYLPTNLGDYLVWQLRAQYWNNNRSGLAKSIGLLRKMDAASQRDAANLYYVLALMDRGRLDDAKTVFTMVLKPDAVSVPMTEYIRGRLAVEGGDYRQAMQHVSKVIAFHSRDPEWMPPATALEARVYQETGQLQKAETVANELMIAYPGTRWSALGEQIKKKTTGTRGG
jgi:tetratricopeptide (TPR) repeat protein